MRIGMLVVVCGIFVVCGCGKQEDNKPQRVRSEADRLWCEFQRDVWQSVESNLVAAAGDLPCVGEFHDANAVNKFRASVEKIRTIVFKAKDVHTAFVDRLRKVENAHSIEADGVTYVELEAEVSKELDLHLEKCEAMESLVDFLVKNDSYWSPDEEKECAKFKDKQLRKRYQELLGRVIILDMHIDTGILETYRQAKFFGRRFAD